MSEKHQARGRPKGALLTAVGSPKAKNSMPFIKKHNKERVIQMLTWLNLPEVMITNVIRQEYLIKISDVSLTVVSIKDNFINENVDINILNDYFVSEAFTLRCDCINKKKQQSRQSCNICLSANCFKSICCDVCLNLYHCKCIGITRKPQKAPWSCHQCKK